jgi:hypothetical protein
MMITVIFCCLIKVAIQYLRQSTMDFGVLNLMGIEMEMPSVK